MTAVLQSRLWLYNCAIGSDFTSIEALQDRPYADVTDESSRQLLTASADEFFRLYGNGTTIVNAHACPGLLAKAVSFLSGHCGEQLVLSGCYGKTAVASVQNQALQEGVALELYPAREPRLLRAEVTDGDVAAFIPAAGFASEKEALAACLASGLGVRGALHWTNMWKMDATARAVELGMRKRDSFYAVARALALCTAGPVNWSEIGEASHIPGPTVRDWTKLLESFAALDIIPAVNLKPERRTLERPKIYWRHPGLGLWLSGRMNNPGEKLLRSLFENAVYLALVDAYPLANVFHFADTNHVVCPMVLETESIYRAYYFYADALEREQAERHHKSLVKTGKFASKAGFIEYAGMTQASRVCYAEIAAAKRSGNQP